MSWYLLVFAAMALPVALFGQDDKPDGEPYPNPQNLDQAIANIFEPMMGTKAVGAALGIVSGDKEYTYFFGECRKGAGDIPNDKTVFEIGSISKAFTALLLAEAVVRNELDLNGNVAEKLPEITDFPQYEDQPMTLLHLANHTSGLPRLPGEFFNYPDFSLQNPYMHYTQERMIAYLNGFTPERAPGLSQEYSNLAYGLLGHLLSKQQQSSFADLMKKRVLKPLSMNATVVHGVPEGYDLSDVHDFSLNSVPVWDFPDYLAGMGSIRSTLPDMLRFLKANMGALPANPLRTSMDLSHRITCSLSAPFHTGLGWWMWEQDDKTYVIWHNGGTAGSASLIAFHKEWDFGMVLLFNTNVRGPFADEGVDQQNFERVLEAVRAFE